ncbi:MAG: hypothetical protein V3U92_02105 [Cellulophaga sp.]
MKIIYNYIGILSFVILTILSCTKEVEVISVFEFTPTEASNVANINNPVAISGLIEEKGFSSKPYSLSFKSTKAATLLYKGEPYLVGETIQGITDLRFNFDYLGTTGGDHDIEFVLTNSIGEVVSKDISITYNVSDFNFTAIPEDDDVELEQIINLNYNIMEVDAGRNYKLKYTIDEGDIIILDDGNERKAGVLYDIPVGDFTWTLKPTTTEDISISFFAQNDNGVTKTATIKLSVTDVSFTYELIYQSTILTSDASKIELKLTGSEQRTYTLAYNITPIDGSTIFSDGLPVAQNTPLTLGSYFMDFNFTTATTYDVEFIVTNNLGIQIKKNAEITVNQTPFTANITNDNEITVNEPLSLDLSLGGSSDLIYTLSPVVSTGTGTFSIGSNTVVNQGSTSFIYTPLVSGEQELEFTIKDNFGNEQIVNKTILVKNPIPIINNVDGFKDILGQTGSLAAFFPFTQESVNVSGWDSCRKRSSYIIFETASITSSTPIVEYRYKGTGSTFITAPYQEHTNLIGIKFFGTSNGFDIFCEDIDSDGDTTSTRIYEDDLIIKRNVDIIQLQVKDSEGQWSELVNVTRF